MNYFLSEINLITFNLLFYLAKFLEFVMRTLFVKHSVFPVFPEL